MSHKCMAKDSSWLKQTIYWTGIVTVELGFTLVKSELHVPYFR